MFIGNSWCDVTTELPFGSDYKSLHVWEAGSLITGLKLLVVRRLRMGRHNIVIISVNLRIVDINSWELFHVDRVSSFTF